MKEINYDNLPEHMRDGARLYVEQGIPPGDFMWAVLCNDLTEAFGRADHINRYCMEHWCRWLYNECPCAAWHNEATVKEWIAHSGLKGLNKEEAE